MKLTERAVRDLCPPERGDRLVFDDHQRGLCVRVTAKGSKIFQLQYWRAGRTHRLRLGEYPVQLSVAGAREAAKRHLVAIASGGDPAADRRAAKAEQATDAKAAAVAAAADAFTLEALIQEWEARGLRGNRPRYRREAVRALRKCCDAILPRPAAQVDTAHVRPLLRALAAEHPATARRTLAYGRACFNWAIKHEMVEANPFLGIALDGRDAPRERVLTDAETGEIWRAAGRLAPPWGLYVRLLVLTLQRRDEVAGMAWAELAEDRQAWELPGARTKNGRANIVHLAPAAQAVVAAVPRVPLAGAPGGASPLVFTTNGRAAISGFSKAKVMLDQAIVAERREKAAQSGGLPEPLAPWRLHDLRRTGVTTMARLGVPWAVADRVLNHVKGVIAGVAATYQRYEFMAERRQALELWADHVVAVADAGAPARPNVLPLRRPK